MPDLAHFGGSFSQEWAVPHCQRKLGVTANGKAAGSVVAVEPKGDVTPAPGARAMPSDRRHRPGLRPVRDPTPTHTPLKRLRVEDAQAAIVGVSREAAARTGVAVILMERAANCSASSWNVLQRSPYWSRSRGGSRPAVDNRCAGTNTRKGAGRRASRITAATSFAGRGDCDRLPGDLGGEVLAKIGERAGDHGSGRPEQTGDQRHLLVVALLIFPRKRWTNRP